MSSPRHTGLDTFAPQPKRNIMNHPNLADRLRYHRKIKGYSQEELSKRTNVTVRTIQRIENAEVNPHLNTIKLLAAALDVEIIELMPIDNPKEETIQKKWLLLMHATPLIGNFIPFCNILIPLFLWIHKREDNPVYDQHGVKVINFQITTLLLIILALIALVTMEKWGFFFFVGTILFCTSMVIFNIVLVLQKGTCYYPLSIPFLRTKKTTPGLFKKRLGVLSVMAMISCAANHSPTIERLDGTTITTDSLTNKITQLMDAAQVHGMAISVFNNRQPVYQQVFGYKDVPNLAPLTDTTNIYGASFSKAVFSVLVMKMIEEGIIDLDTPLESYLPKKLYEYEPQTRWHDDFSSLQEDSLYHLITARMCLAHTTGFLNYRRLEEDHKLRVHTTPGTNYWYSGEGFIYLQVVLEKLTGQGLEQLASDLIFKPLSMTQSAYEWKPRFDKDFAYGHNAHGDKYKKDKDNEPRGGGTLETTASDYTRFLTAILNQEIISPESYNEIFSPQIRIKSKTQFGPKAKQTTDQYDNINLSCGLAWEYYDTPHGRGVSKAGHGDGFQHYSILFPDSGLGLMIMTNSDNGESIFKELLEVAIKDVYTPWEWMHYIPYQMRE